MAATRPCKQRQSSLVVKLQGSLLVTRRQEPSARPPSGGSPRSRGVGWTCSDGEAPMAADQGSAGAVGLRAGLGPQPHVGASWAALWPGPGHTASATWAPDSRFQRGNDDGTQAGRVIPMMMMPTSSEREHGPQGTRSTPRGTPTQRSKQARCLNNRGQARPAGQTAASCGRGRSHTA